ncbi:hypothetical protein OPV22_015264 [Ensete ventricosum]|uniref:1-phosphatidylinositol-4-phosphate 5-kinase n=1 Tax=Ensete ventricosum TaxID=4639 RepID=A0AAV8RBI1_ENSVE|nr:hypothetical protein OPV22_015264 [Ensete ventricosum]
MEGFETFIDSEGNACPGSCVTYREQGLGALHHVLRLLGALGRRRRSKEAEVRPSLHPPVVGGRQSLHVGHLLATSHHRRMQKVWKPLIPLGLNMPARAEQTGRSESDALLASGRTQNDKIHDVILYVWNNRYILQDYDVTKKLEHAYKSSKVDSSSISAVDPKALYSRRFQDFIRRIFMEDD